MRAHVVLLAACHAAAVYAEAIPDMPRLSPSEIAEANAACESLGKIPNAPMSVEACKSMLGMASTMQRMDAAANDPSARRHQPGGVPAEGRQGLGCLTHEKGLVRAGRPGDISESLDRVHQG